MVKQKKKKFKMWNKLLAFLGMFVMLTGCLAGTVQAGSYEAGKKGSLNLTVQQTDEEGKVWHIKIRENAKWENGDAIDVDDVIYSFKMCLDPIMVNSRASQLASDYITITKASDYSLQGNAGTVAWEDVRIKKADDYTLELQLDAHVTAEDIKSHINYVWTCLVHEPTYEACMSEDRSTNTYGSTREKYMSCGAFILDQWIAGSHFDMKKNRYFVLVDKI